MTAAAAATSHCISLEDARLAWVGDRACSTLDVGRDLFNQALLDGDTLGNITPFFEGGAPRVKIKFFGTLNFRRIRVNGPVALPLA